MQSASEFRRAESFAYSGELPNRAFKSTIDFQIAGTHIVVKETKDGRQYNAVSDVNKKIISDWYRGKCFLYDNSCLDGEETESLVNIAENVINTSESTDEESGPIYTDEHAVFIVGSVEYATDWLSFTENGEPLVPEMYVIYTVESGDYQGSYVWDGNENYTIYER